MDTYTTLVVERKIPIKTPDNDGDCRIMKGFILTKLFSLPTKV